jgi:4-aminobutyrate aminotransferase-like enzyme
MAKGARGSQGGTYGANAVACAAALATLDAIEQEHLVENAAQRGEQMWQQLHALKSDYPMIATIRGKGLMLGMEIGNGPQEPRPDLAQKLTEASERHGLLLLRCGIDGQIVRWLPPLVVTEADVTEAATRFSKALAEVAA